MIYTNEELSRLFTQITGIPTDPNNVVNNGVYVATQNNQIQFNVDDPKTADRLGIYVMKNASLGDGLGLELQGQRRGGLPFTYAPATGNSLFFGLGELDMGRVQLIFYYYTFD
jgi:hypothetical protein